MGGRQGSLPKQSENVDMSLQDGQNSRQGVLRIIQDDFSYFSTKNIRCDSSLEPFWRDGSNDGSQRTF